MLVTEGTVERAGALAAREHATARQELPAAFESVAARFPVTAESG